ncbi:MAG: hypothetical protein A3B92_02205 [Candidatus Harrisonbacteria bacterium RIFCSPHIGHO2_02_FULL_42_16]|uniref:Outer membrane protein beta-barrel domain-containing protein n=1 Tax=Candidatus Harrisonbacteria bacterium RIFCSPHIGHO2_02_FULL_42_16 TaxID=1798404 RepID=A0A1G1ZH34_9BACT|nr:MAG: hypothetical protein A3B92_02205 [Candidatus Harrisonbacteria bacterium RIFCSPHIGHO2_02_FULL_42_16]
MKLLKRGLFLVALFVVQPAFSAEQRSKLFAVEASGGYYKVPGELFDVSGSIVRHPPGLYGYAKTAHLDFFLFEHWLVGVNAFDFVANGDGEWRRNDTDAVLVANKLVGIITGKTDWRLQGGAVEAEYRFFNGPVKPYFRAGIGYGKLKVKFKGRFQGHETFSGLNFLVSEPAEDEVSRSIPVVAAEAGLRFEIWKHSYFFMGAAWNTGMIYQAGAGLGF